MDTLDRISTSFICTRTHSPTCDRECAAWEAEEEEDGRNTALSGRLIKLTDIGEQLCLGEGADKSAAHHRVGVGRVEVTQLIVLGGWK